MNEELVNFVYSNLCKSDDYIYVDDPQFEKREIRRAMLEDEAFLLVAKHSGVFECIAQMNQAYKN